MVWIIGRNPIKESSILSTFFGQGTKPSECKTFAGSKSQLENNLKIILIKAMMKDKNLTMPTWQSSIAMVLKTMTFGLRGAIPLVGVCRHDRMVNVIGC